MIYVTFSLLMFFLHILFLYFSFFFYTKMFILDLFLFPFGFFNFNLMFLLDLYSFSFSSVVFLISALVIVYSYFYMEGDLMINRYFFLLLMFVFSMMILIFSPNMFSILLGWDGLGLTSFCLIIYYGGFSSTRSGMVSIFLNRFGDMGLIICLFIMGSNGFWEFFLTFDSFFLLSILFMISSMTKSAQMPFSSWLPVAMAAPTPISSLVHSSTLVTAGVYLMVRYNYFFLFFYSSVFFSYMSLSTMIMAGFIAMFEADMKKVVAMSTLSQLGLMMYMLSLGELSFCFFHMLTHALFKSLLFLSCGGLMSYSWGNQDFRFKGMSTVFGIMHCLGFCVSSLSLVGFPFLAGFFSKDLCLDSLIEFNVGFCSLIFFFLGCIMTIFYSFRIFMIALNSNSFLNSSLSFSYSFFSYFYVILIFFSIFGGKFFGVLFIVDELVFSFGLLKLVGCFLIISLFSFPFFIKLVFCDFFLSMFSLDLVFGHSMSKFFFSKKFFSLVDLSWFELLGPFGISKLLLLTSVYFRKFEEFSFYFKSFTFFCLYVIYVCMIIFILML